MGINFYYLTYDITWYSHCNLSSMPCHHRLEYSQSNTMQLLISTLLDAYSSAANCYPSRIPRVFIFDWNNAAEIIHTSNQNPLRISAWKWCKSEQISYYSKKCWNWAITNPILLLFWSDGHSKLQQESDLQQQDRKRSSLS